MNPSEFRDIKYEVTQPGIATLTFATPKRKNALSVYTFFEMYEAVDAFEKDDSLHALVMTGEVAEGDLPEKQAYSSGGYFNQDAYNGVDPEILSQLDFTDIAQKRITLKMFNCEKPIIAAVNGLAIGGAVTLTLAVADQIYLSEHAWMQLPFAKLGISAELASSFLLPRILGMQKAKEILFYSDVLTAEQAKGAGLINAVIPHADLLDHAYERASMLVPPKGAALSIRAMKRLLHEPLKQQLSDALDRENVELAALMQSADFAEGVAARVEKRAAAFSGK